MSLIGSTICNIALLRKGVSKTVAFWGTVFGFGIVNFMVLKFFIGEKQKDHSKEQHDLNDSTTKNKGKNTSQRDKNTRNRRNDNENGRKKSNLSSKRGRSTNSNDKNSATLSRRFRGGASFVSDRTTAKTSCSSTTTQIGYGLYGDSVIMNRLVNELIVGTNYNHEYDSQIMSFVKSVRSI